jgi:pyridoxal/pyridoxine/pyridoxamine kinase
MNGEQLEQIAQGLHDNLLDDYNYVLTGYIGNNHHHYR